MSWKSTLSVKRLRCKTSLVFSLFRRLLSTQEILHKEAIINPSKFWHEPAKDIDWHTFPTTIYNESDVNHPLGYSWFNGGKLNMSYNCIDRHIKNGRGDSVALIHESPVTNTRTSYTFNQLLEKVELLSGALVERGLNKGDRVIIYLSMCPEAIISMLAVARIGCIHSVVFGGFSAVELHKRIEDCKPKVIISCSGGKEMEKVIEYKPILDEAIELTSPQNRPKHCLILQRNNICNASLNSIRDEDFYTVLNNSNRKLGKPVLMNSNDALYLLYTSGTTGIPKGVLRDTGGYATVLRYTMEHFYGCNPGETFFAASDIGWVVGHSYCVYGPLLNGCASVIFESKPIYPDAGIYWKTIEQHNVKSMFSAPTAIRAIKKEDPTGEFLKKRDITSLRNLFLAGERCDVPTIKWLSSILPNVNIFDHYWQTETGYPILGYFLGDNVEKRLEQCYGSGGKEFPGMKCKILQSIDDESDDMNMVTLDSIKEVKSNEIGELVLDLPLPPGSLHGLYNDYNFNKINKAYFSRYEKHYWTGDSAMKDENNYYHVMARVDDVINTAAHRLSTGHMEQIISSLNYVAECAVIGVDDIGKTQIPVGIVVLQSNCDKTISDVKNECKELLRSHIGAIVSYNTTIIVNKLPKTRSGKTLRRSLREIIQTGDIKSYPPTIEDPSAIDEFKIICKQLGII